MRIIAVVNQKGGVGKTSIVMNMGAGLALKGKKVLLIDFDPQSNLTEGFGINPEGLSRSIYEALGGTSLPEVIVNVGEGLDLAPASMQLSGAEAELLQLADKDKQLRNCIDQTSVYDYVIIDCPPSLGQLTLNALAAAKEVFIPIQTEYYALKGVSKLLTTVELVRRFSNAAVEITGVIACRYDARKRLNRGVIEQLKQHFPEVLFGTAIRENIAIAEAPTVALDIFGYKPHSNGAADFDSLCTEIIRMEEK